MRKLWESSKLIGLGLLGITGFPTAWGLAWLDKKFDFLPNTSICNNLFFLSCACGLIWVLLGMVILGFWLF